MASPIITISYIFQLLFSLLIVVGLIYVTGKYLLPKFQIGKIGKYIEIVDRVPLEPRVTTYIIKVGKSYWLIAVSDKNITKIDKLNESEIT